MPDVRRQQLLEAMGVTLYRRRGADSPAAGVAAIPPSRAGASVHEPAAADTGQAHVRERTQAVDAAPVLVVVGARADRACADILARALALAPARLVWIEATTEALSCAPPQAAAYLALGDSFARPLGAELPTSVQQSAQIVVASAPAQWRDAAAKRALWQVLKPLRRALLRS